MKSFFTVIIILLLNLPSLSAVEVVEVSTNRNCPAEEIENTPIYDCEGIFPQRKNCNPPVYDGDGIFPRETVEDGDPLEPINRGIFWVNQGIDYLIIEPIAGAYSELVPEYVRDRVSNILRNLNEPIVLANNLLQGELEDGRTTIWRFLLNSTIGIVGIFDVSTDLGFPYKKEDLGLTFASWGVEPGPYLILPILGPSTARDAWGRIGDYALDPINWWTFGIQSTTRSAVQVLDAKTDNIDIMDDIKRNAIDHYASIRTWYTERRNSLRTAVEDRQAVDTPRPDEEEDDEKEKKDTEEEIDQKPLNSPVPQTSK